MFYLNQVNYKNILDINELQIPAGKVTCIVGESGSGKTTLLRMLNKLISPDSGVIYFRDIPLDKLNSVELRREVVMLAQNPAIFDGTVRDNLLIGLNFSEKPPVYDEEMLDILKLVNLKKKLDEDTDKLSGGEKQRLALGRLLLMNPEVLLLDEPSSALDEATEKIIIERTVAFARDKNKTLIMVTHSKKVAEDFSDITIEINKGQIISKGSL
jgi:putative ABC transport system ATP-binding protein